MKIETKFDIGKTVYGVIGNSSPEIRKVKIEKIRAIISKDEDENLTCYSCTDEAGYAVSIYETQLFSTEGEAKQDIKEQIKFLKTIKY